MGARGPHFAMKLSAAAAFLRSSSASGGLKSMKPWPATIRIPASTAACTTLLS